MSRQTRRDRRDLDYAQRRAAANKRIGHDLAYTIYWWELLRWPLAAGVVVAALWWVWTHVAHGTIAAVLAVLGLGAVSTSGWFLSRGGFSTQQRVTAIAHGREINRSMWWMVAAGGVLLLAAAVAVVKVAP